MRLLFPCVLALSGLGCHQPTAPPEPIAPKPVRDFMPELEPVNLTSRDPAPAETTPIRRE